MSAFNEYEEARRLLVRAVASIKGKEPDLARRYLEHTLRLPTTSQQKADAYFLLSLVSHTPQEKREHLATSLGYDHNHYRARKELAILDGKLKESEIINPDNFTPADPESPQQRDGERFVCPNCGGRRTYSPDGITLVCEYCDQNKANEHDGPAVEHDAIIGMAKAQGHQKATATQSFECKACGAVFLLAPKVITLTCPHCDSAYSITQSEIRELLPPQGMIPFEINKKTATQAVKSWIEKKAKVKGRAKFELTGIYLPAWTFDFSGEIKWTGYIQQDDDKPAIPVKDFRYVHLDDVFVPASKPTPKHMQKLLRQFHAKDVISYNPDYTANWLAETYQITLSDAAVDAHAQAFKLAQEIAKRKGNLGRVRNLNFTSDGIMMQTYKLVLVPVWMGHYTHEDETYDFLVNGKSGDILADKPPGAIKKFVNWLMEE